MDPHLYDLTIYCNPFLYSFKKIYTPCFVIITRQKHHKCKCICWCFFRFSTIAGFIFNIDSLCDVFRITVLKIDFNPQIKRKRPCSFSCFIFLPFLSSSILLLVEFPLPQKNNSGKMN